MIYTTNNEQGFAFRVHNTSWTPVNYDGITLMRRPQPFTKSSFEKDILKQGFSKAAIYQQAKLNNACRIQNQYVILDVETTGLDFEKDRIIEIGAIRIINNEIVDIFQRIINVTVSIPQLITEITGITADSVGQGIEEKEALEQFLEFVGTDNVIGYNVSFDLNFINSTAERLGVPEEIKQARDVLTLARRKIDDLQNYQLSTVARFFKIEPIQQHRAIQDCELVYQVYLKLNEMR
jgi:CRISPR-associated protein Cas2